MASSLASEDLLVYGDLDGDLVALQERRARELVAVHEAVGQVDTLEELRSRIPRGDFDALVAHLEIPPALDEPFNPDEVGAIADGDWPEWPQQRMLNIVPGSVQQALGSVEFSRVSGDCLVIPFAREKDFISTLSQSGWRVRRDDALVSRASGHG